MFKDKYKANFIDLVHGNIHVTEDEIKVVDHYIFQKLRKIKQLGKTHLIYPSAVHTRFSHSLGVMHVAGRIFEALLRDIFYSRKNDIRSIEDSAHGNNKIVELQKKIPW